MAGTIYDKFCVCGRKKSVQKENWNFLRLVEFAPFRNWSPVRESLEEKYPATYEGIAMYGAVCGDGTGSRIFGTASFVPQISIEISGTVADKSADGSKQRATFTKHLTGSGSRVRYL